MFKKRQKLEQDGLVAIQSIAASLAAIAESQKQLQETFARIEPKVDAIYDVYKGMNP
jgi:hypothetical protein